MRIRSRSTGTYDWSLGMMIDKGLKWIDADIGTVRQALADPE